MVRLTDRPDMTLDVYRGRKTTIQYNSPLDTATVPVTAEVVSPPHSILCYKVVVIANIII